MGCESMLEKCKLAMAITTNAYDAEIQDLIDAALLDLGIAGVNSALIHDKLIQRAVITYVRMMFHSPADFDHLRWAYETEGPDGDRVRLYGMGAAEWFERMSLL